MLNVALIISIEDGFLSWISLLAVPEMTKYNKIQFIKNNIWNFMQWLNIPAVGEWEHSDSMWWSTWNSITLYRIKVSIKEVLAFIKETRVTYSMREGTSNISNMLFNQFFSKQPKGRFSINEIYQNMWVGESKHYLDFCRSECFHYYRILCKFFYKN